MNTLTYNPNNNRYYTTNAVVDGYIVTPIEADSMIVEAPIKIERKRYLILPLIKSVMNMCRLCL